VIRRIGVYGACLALLGWATAVATSAPDPPDPPVRFDSEIVRLDATGDTLIIEGFYRFLCSARAPERLTLFYPYPQDSLLGAASTLQLEARRPGEAWRPQPFEELSGGRGARWNLARHPSGAAVADAPAGPAAASRVDTLEVQTTYRQPRRGDYACYIVTTTSRWNRPLTSARFEICLPGEARAPRFSYPFERFDDARPCYRFDATGFMPERDIVVSWSGPE
jgi:hypothetical protein